jgi:hypothetical protein
MKMGPEKGPALDIQGKKTGSNFCLDEAIDILVRLPL